MGIKNRTAKIISAILIVAILVPTVLLGKPKEAEATGIPVIDIVNWVLNGYNLSSTTVNTGGTIANTALHIKDFAIQISKQVLMAVAKKALAEMTKSTVNWINSGFHGQPLFLQNPDSFFQDIAKSEVKTLANQYGYDSLRYPFGKQIVLNAINSYKSTAQDNATYTLSKVINDPVLLNNYQNNFAVGGWNGFLINTQYPQNNYLGFSIIANQQLASQTENQTQKVQNLLQQGGGFLSPQTCPSNPNYPIATNPYNPPTFDEGAYLKAHPYDPSSIPECASDPEGQACQQHLQTYDALWESKHSGAKTAWATSNTCPGGLVNTTPGSVVASQITTSLGSVIHNAELSAALGNSLSAIFDSLLNHFLDKGLNSLASKVNSQPASDNFTYNGLSLGSSTPVGVNSTWDTGPDQPIVLSDFKKTVNDAYDNTNKELLMMTNNTPNDSGPGIIQILAQIWPKVQTLDMCQPGPDLGWENRLDEEVAKVTPQFTAGEGEDPTAGYADLKELQFAVSYFKDWIRLQAVNALPSSSSNLDAINDLKNLYQEASELDTHIQTTKAALSQLQSIKTSLFGITSEPTPGSAEEATLVSLYKQYSGLTDSLSNDITVQNTQSELITAKNKLTNIDNLITKCTSERTLKGWSNPGGADSTKGGATEQQTFCDSPIAGGYSHESFVQNGTVSYPTLPLVNAQDVQTGSGSVNVSLSCGIIYKASSSDYKGTLPGF